jgi:hypothetical protein
LEALRRIVRGLPANLSAALRVVIHKEGADDAIVSDMPESAISYTDVDYVLQADRIPSLLVELVNGSGRKSATQLGRKNGPLKVSGRPRQPDPALRRRSSSHARGRGMERIADRFDEEGDEFERRAAAMRTAIVIDEPLDDDRAAVSVARRASRATKA